MSKERKPMTTPEWFFAWTFWICMAGIMLAGAIRLAQLILPW